jgi:DNA-binding response OmpR family regulator
MPKDKILIIEDEPDQILMMKTRLVANNYEVFEALDGETGLEKARQVKPDLIILDLILPKIDGNEVCRRLKQDAIMKKIPVIVITAYGLSNLKEKCFAQGADDCMRKPYISGELLNKIKTNLARAKRAEAKKKVLVVDDEQDFLKLMKVRLEANNYEVLTASDGKEALAKIKSEKPAMVLLDLVMPGLDGLKVLENIRRFDKKLPVFIITAFSSKERFKIATEFGASGILLKTSNLNEEVANMSAVLNLSKRYKGSK